jgi:hypothetical protein
MAGIALPSTHKTLNSTPAPLRQKIDTYVYMNYMKQQVEIYHLPSMCQTLGSIPTPKK